MDLKTKKCVPCEIGTPPLSHDQVKNYIKQLKLDWEIIEGKKIKREFKFDTYIGGLKFASRVGQLAEEEDHHPSIHIYYKKVVIDLTTHSIGGLSENDMVMAAKVENLYNVVI